MTEKIVPWVALRKDEYDNVPPMPWAPWGFDMPTDRRGVKWMLYGDSFSGDPLFAHVHPVRQKMCMEDPRCQVCGRRINPNKTPWLLDDDMRDTDPNWLLNPIETHTPPTCEECWPKAKELCPHLRRTGGLRVYARKISVVGVFGDYYPSPDPERTETGLLLRFRNPKSPKMLRHFIAKQLVVEISRIKLASSERSD